MYIWMHVNTTELTVTTLSKYEKPRYLKIKMPVTIKVKNTLN